MTRTLANRCSDEFNSHDWGRGVDYFHRRAVSISSQGADGLEALVQGSGRSPYRVRLDWSHAKQNRLHVRCSCPRFDDVGLCKHVVATILAADARHLAVVVPGNGDLLLFDEEEDPTRFEEEFAVDVEEGEEGWIDDPESDQEFGSGLDLPRTPRAQFSAPTASRRPTRPPTWKQQLDALEEIPSYNRPGSFVEPGGAWSKPREIWYLLDLPRTLSRGRLCLSLRQCLFKKDGNRAKLKIAKFMPSDAVTLPLAEDRELVALLSVDQRDLTNGFMYGGYYSNHVAFCDFAVAPALFDVLLPRLCASGRFGWLPEDSSTAEAVQRFAWDDGPAWALSFNISKAPDEKHWALCAALVRGDESAALSGPLALLPDGLVIFPDRIARFDPAGNFPWIALLRQQSALLVPVKDQEQFVERLLQMPHRPGFEFPAELRWQEERPTPLPLLRVSKSGIENQLDCSLDFRYGDRSVRFEDERGGWYDRKTRQAVHRELGAERAARELLFAAGAQLVIGSFGATNRTRHWIAADKLPRLVSQLTQAGWHVEAEGSVIRAPCNFALSVTSGIDWFDLEGDCDFGGMRAGLPELLAALRRGEQFVRLDDGSQGLIPAEWLKRHAPWAELGKVEEGRIRFLPAQAGFLDALLAAQEPRNVRVDQAFVELRERLRSFEGIAPAHEPPTFVGQLRPYQREGLGWLHFLDQFGFGGCLADDMGLGKTIQVLAFLDERRQIARDGESERKTDAAAPVGASLVVVPRSLVFNWLDEAHRFTPHLRVLDYTGLERREAFERISDSDLVLTTYGTLRRDIARLRTHEFDYAILDEAQAIKNASSQSAKACRLLCARRRLAMTGTPVENHLGELWSLFEFLNPGMLGRREGLSGLTSSGQRSGPRSQAEGDRPPTDLTTLSRALRPFLLRRTKEQVLSDLPSKTEQTLFCELDEQERALYDELRDHYRAKLTSCVARFGIGQSKIHVLEALLRLRQAACHPGLLDKKKIDSGSAKLETLLAQLAEVIEEGHKALVFSQFTSLLAIVRSQLDHQRVVYEYLDGRTAKRQAKVERFQTDPACKLFLISLKAGGQGLNLTAADYVFILDPWWNPAVEAQAVDRAHRIGQSRHVFAYRLIARETVEEKILQLQDQKRGLAEAIITADNSILRSLTAEDLQLLLS